MTRPTWRAVLRATFRLLGYAVVQHTKDLLREFRIHLAEERARDAGRRER